MLQDHGIIRKILQTVSRAHSGEQEAMTRLKSVGIPLSLIRT